MEQTRRTLPLESQWATVSLLFVALFFCVGACATQPPTIQVMPVATNSSQITFYNGTLIVVSKQVFSIRLTCNASYPVMWSLDSLEQPWTRSTASYRYVTDFTDKYTYLYSMLVELGNYDYDYIRQIDLEPEEYICHAAAGAELSSSLVSKMFVVWEARSMNQSILLRKKSQNVYWGPNRSDTHEILIPCFTVNANDSTVELFRKSNGSRTRTLLAAETPDRPFNSTGVGIRFEKYVGFFLKPSMVAEDDELYECRVKEWKGESTDTSATQMTSPTFTTTQATRILSTEANSNGSIADLVPDYAYISSEDELLQPSKSNVTNTTATSTDDGELEPLEDDYEDPNTYRLMIRLFRRNSSADDSTWKAGRGQAPDTLSTYLNRKNPKLKLERTDSTTVSCCVDHGNYTADNMVLYHKWCFYPLICLTKSHLLKGTYLFTWAKEDLELSSQCRYINTKDEARTSYYMRPTLYICHMRTDLRFTRRNYSGDYHLSRHLETSENSYLLEATNNGTAYTDQEYYDAKTEKYFNDFSKVTFYEGQAAKFRCPASSFFYATGKVWELHWKNGTSKILLPQDRDTDHTLELRISAALARISCHFPPWNSTEWATRSADIKTQEAKPPSSASGQSYLSETVEFLVGESRELNCTLSGHPPPKYEWTILSSAYTILERQPKYYYQYDYHDTPYYTGQSPSYHTSPKIQNVTVTVSSYYSRVNTTGPVPVGTIKCAAENVVGSGFIQFRLQAKRPELPELGFEGRGLNRVFFVHDTARLLNCTVRKGLPRAVIYWQRTNSNMNITNSEHYEIQESGNSSALLFKSSIDYEDEGDYTCIAANLAGNATLQFRVRIREPSPHSSHPWYEFGLIILALLIIVVIAAFVFVCIRKSRKISRLEMRAEYSKAFGDHEDEASRLTVATGF